MAGLVQGPTIPTLTIAGRTFTDLGNIITLTGYIYGTQASPPLFKNNQPLIFPYQVPLNKTLKVFAVDTIVTLPAVGANTWSFLGYADNALTAPWNPASLSNPTYLGGGSPYNGAFCVTTQPGQFEKLIYFEIPSLKFPFIQSTDLGASYHTSTFYGYEV